MINTFQLKGIGGPDNHATLFFKEGVFTTANQFHAKFPKKIPFGESGRLADMTFQQLWDRLKTTWADRRINAEVAYMLNGDTGLPENASVISLTEQPL